MINRFKYKQLVFFFCSFLFFGEIGLTQQYDVVWTDLVNVTANGNSITKTSGGDDWNAGAASTSVLPANTDGWVEISPGGTNWAKYISLNTSRIGVNLGAITYGLQLTKGGRIHIWEYNIRVQYAIANYNENDLIRIERIGGVVRYKKNGNVFYTSQTNSNTSLVLNAIIRHFGGTIDNAHISFGSGPVCTDADADMVCSSTDCDDNDSNIGAPGSTCLDIHGNSSTLDNNCNCIDLGACYANGGDSDGDGICANEDCNDNANSIGGIGSPCVDANNNNSTYGNDCNCIELGACVGNGGDADGDGVCANEDCDDTNSSIGAVGSACTDGHGNPSTLGNDCNCIDLGPCHLYGGDKDGDGICFDEDCNDDNSSIGAVGSSCDDGDPTTINDVIQPETCICQGTTAPTGGGFFVNDDSATDMDIRYSGGKVTIGNNDTDKTANDYLLFVEKGIMTEKAKVSIKNSASWADYVFEKDYDLNSIEQVANFIVKNKHLPNVPSAKEVAQEGIDVAKMDATLLRQIEELWLHLIELKKENEILKDKIKLLEQN